MLRRVFFSIFSLCTALSLSAEILPDYVVTANRAGEDSLDSGARVTVVTDDEIARSGKTSVVEVLKDVAGVTFRSYSSEAQAQVSMRGFGENSFGRVLVLVDGRKQNDPDMTGINWQAIQVSSIERIEILDGPASVMYGSGAVGGVINIVTKKGSKDLTAEATVSYGSFDTRRALVAGGYGNDSLGILVSADIYRTDGYRDRSATKDTNATASGFWNVTDLVALKPYFTYSDVSYRMPGGLTKAQFEADPTLAAKTDDDGAEKSLGAGMLASYLPGDLLTLECPLDWKQKDREGNFGSAEWPSFSNTGIVTVGARPKAIWTGDTGNGDFSLTAGVDLERTGYECDTWTDEARTAGHDGFEIDQFTVAPYLALAAALPANLAAQGGLRYDHTAIDARKTAFDESDGYDTVSWDASLSWRPRDEFSAYARSGSMYRVPFIDEKAQLYGGAQFNADLDPERGWNAEIGARYRKSKRLAVAASLYYMLMEDEIAFDMTTYRNVNMDRTHRLGGSASAYWKPVSPLAIEGDIAFVRATFVTGDYDGNAVPLVPALTARLGANCALPFGISLGGDVAFEGESYAGQDFANDADRVDAHALVGLTVAFAPPVKGSSLAVRMRVNNLLDESYAALAYYSSYAGETSYYPADGRSFTVSATYKY